MSIKWGFYCYLLAEILLRTISIFLHTGKIFFFSFPNALKQPENKASRGFGYIFLENFG